MWRFISWIASFSESAGDSDDEQLAKGVLSLLALSIVLGMPADIITMLRAGDRAAGGGLVAVWAGAVAGVLHFLATKRRKPLQLYLFTVMALAPIAGHLHGGGFSRVGPLALWSALVPFGALLLSSRRESAAWLVAYVAAVSALIACETHLPPPATALPPSVLLYLHGSVLLGFVLTVYSIVFHFLTRLQRERARSERLLLNILPHPIAERLKQTPSTIADGFAEVTVLFADLVGFTQLSASIPADQLVITLNRVFTAFDALAARHGVEKIKTIGDAYMAAAGVPSPSTDHVETIARMALDMVTALEEANRELGLALQIRIGINTGPVVAGVIGAHRFIYDMWGDTVNVASRMESTGHPGRIQVTAEVHARLAGRFRFEPRGEVSVKGKGTLTTYFLVGAA